MSLSSQYTRLDAVLPIVVHRFRRLALWLRLPASAMNGKWLQWPKDSWEVVSIFLSGRELVHEDQGLTSMERMTDHRNEKTNVYGDVLPFH